MKYPLLGLVVSTCNPALERKKSFWLLGFRLASTDCIVNSVPTTKHPKQINNQVRISQRFCGVGLGKQLKAKRITLKGSRGSHEPNGQELGRPHQMLRRATSQTSLRLGPIFLAGDAAVIISEPPSGKWMEMFPLWLRSGKDCPKLVAL